MSWEEFLAFFQKRSKMIADIPAKIQNEEELRKLYDDPVVRRRFEKAEKYRRSMERLEKAEEKQGHDAALETNLNRFKVFYFDPAETPEADEYNRDFSDMLLCPEGQTLLAEMTLGDALQADYSIIYPKDIDEAIDQTIAHPTLSEKLMTIKKVTEGGSNYELNPAVEEYFKYNLSSMEDAEVAFGSVNFYAYKWGALLRPEMSMVDYALLIGGMKKDTSDKELMDMQVHMNQMYRFSDENSPYAKAQELRAQGIIGPESRYYRAYDENGERIRFDHAVSKYAAGEKVEFRKMSSDEQQQLDRAFAHPVTIKAQTKTGALSGDGLKEEVRALYEQMQSVESIFHGSSKQFRDIKNALKNLAAMKEPLTEEHAKKFLRQWVPACGKYLNDKIALRNNLQKVNPHYEHSTFVKNRINVMTDVFGKLSRKLGYIAYTDHRIRVKDRTLAANRQKLITNSILNNQQVNADLIAQSETLKQNLENVRPSTAGKAFRNLSQQAVIAGEGLAKDLRETGVGNAPKIRDTAFTDGRYLSMLVAYTIVKEERTRINGADYEKKEAYPVAGPMEILLNKVGSHAFYKAVQNTALMQRTVANGITPQKVRALILNHGEHEFVEKLSTPECIEEIKKNAMEYKAAKDAKMDPALGENVKINNH